MRQKHEDGSHIDQLALNRRSLTLMILGLHPTAGHSLIRFRKTKPHGNTSTAMDNCL